MLLKYLLSFIITNILHNFINNNKIIYGNTGDWIQHKSYIILENGSIKLINLE